MSDILTPKEPKPQLRQLPDVIDWHANQEAGTITLVLKYIDLEAWMIALDGGPLYKMVNNYGGLEPALADGHNFSDARGQTW